MRCDIDCVWGGGEGCKLDARLRQRTNNTPKKGKRLAEANAINSSLLALQQVFRALIARAGRGAGGAHVPFRDSRLTHYLAVSLEISDEGCCLNKWRHTATQNLEITPPPPLT